MAASAGARPLRAAIRDRVRASKKLYDASRELVRQGDIAKAIPALLELSRQSPYASDARQLLAVCNQLRRSRLLDETSSVVSLLEDLRGVDRSAFDESQPHSLLMRRVEGAAETLIVFVTSGTVLWISVALLHHYLRRYPVNIVYVQGEFGLFHMSRLNGLGSDYGASLASLRQLVGNLGAQHAYCVGGSSSGYAALRFGLDLQATAVMSFSGPTTLNPAQISPARRHAVDKLMAVAPAMAVDLAPLYRCADRRPRATLCYGTDHVFDPAQARRMADLDGVRLYPLDGYADHDSLAYFAVNQQFDLMFDLLRGHAP